MQAESGAYPPSLQVARTPPVAVQAYRRRFVSPATNLAVAKPGDTINIYPETSTPSTVIDIKSTYLAANLQIFNAWYAADYANFGIAGAWGSIIQEWAVMNQGTPLELINEYPTAVTTLMNLEGVLDEPTSFYFSNKLKHGYQEDMHKNFIKPPMCTGSGNIMFGFNPFGLGFDTSLKSSGVYLNQLHSDARQTIAGAENVVAGAMTGVFNNNSSLIIQQFAGGSALDLATGFTGGAPTHINSTLLYTSGGAQGSAYLDSKIAPSWVTSGSGAAPGLLAAGTTPMVWPDYFNPKQSSIVSQFVKEFGSINKPQIMANLCNVKCFPIGCAPATDCFSSGNTYGQPASIFTNPTAAVSTNNIDNQRARRPTPTNPTYRILWRPVSGIFGIFASKVLLSMLLAPQQMYISIKLADAFLAFQITSDPCRRIVGTIRDYIRNTGAANGGEYGLRTTIDILDNARNPNFLSNTSGCAPGYIPNLGIRLLNETSGNGTSHIDMLNNATVCGRTILQGGPGDVNQLGAMPQGINGSMAVPPQYALARSPWLYHIFNSPTTTTVTYATEVEMFYGSCLEASVPQCRRIFDLDYQGQATFSSAPPAGSADSNNTGITYQLSNIALVGDMISFPDATAADIIAKAAAGMYNVHTQTLTTTILQVQNSEVQNIIMPIKANQAKKLFVVFQDIEQRSPNTAFFHDSNCGINPFALLDIGVNNRPVSTPINATASAPSGKSGLGIDTNLLGVGTYNIPVYRPTPCDFSGNFSAQLQIGSDLYPQQPLTSMNEIQVELVKTLEKWTDMKYTPNFNSRVCTNGVGGFAYDCLQADKFCTAFVPYDLLDDQTITSNYNMAPLFSYSVGLAAGISSYTAAGGVGSASATRNSALNGYNYICPRGFTAPHFVPPTSRFVLGFSFTTFDASEGVSSAMYLGNNVMTLQLKGAIGLTGHSYGGLRNYRAVAITVQEAVMRYGSGGNVIWVK